MKRLPQPRRGETWEQYEARARVTVIANWIVGFLCGFLLTLVATAR